MKIYIVDNEPISRGMLIERLAQMTGVELCGFAHDSRLAARDIRDMRPDLVVLDVLLYEGNGIEVIKEFAGDMGRPTFIVMTNSPYAHYRERCRQLGVDLFYDKSMEFQEVVELIGSFLKVVRGELVATADAGPCVVR